VTDRYSFDASQPRPNLTLKNLIALLNS